MKRNDLSMHTTKIDPTRTISEIQDYLIRKGAVRIGITTEYGEPISLHFTLRSGTQEVPYKLQPRVDPIYKIIRQNGGNEQKHLDQAKRTAWRLIYRCAKAVNSYSC